MVCWGCFHFNNSLGVKLGLFGFKWGGLGFQPVVKFRISALGVEGWVSHGLMVWGFSSFCGGGCV